MLPRIFYLYEDLDSAPETTTEENRYSFIQYKEDIPEEEANLISSKLNIPGKTNLHAPTLDIDLPVHCYESSTKDHYHLFIDVAMPWWKYKILLRCLAFCGIIEKGYWKASVTRGASLLRKKGVLKKVSTARESTEIAQWRTWT